MILIEPAELDVDTTPISLMTGKGDGLPAKRHSLKFYAPLNKRRCRMRLTKTFGKLNELRPLRRTPDDM